MISVSEDASEAADDGGSVQAPELLKLVGAGVLFVICFLVGFGIIYTVTVGTPSVDLLAEEDPDNTTEDAALSQSNVSAKADEYVMSQLPPFVRNATTVSMEKDTDIEGMDYMWAWTVDLYVEPNSFGQWATNETTIRTETFYLSKNGDYIFYAQPERTEIQQQAPGPLG